MRAYRVKYGPNVKYAGTMADATTAKHELNERLGFDPRSRNVNIEQVEIPTAKDSFLTWINQEVADLKREFDNA